MDVKVDTRQSENTDDGKHNEKDTSCIVKLKRLKIHINEYDFN